MRELRESREAVGTSRDVFGASRVEEKSRKNSETRVIYYQYGVSGCKIADAN